MQGRRLFESDPDWQTTVQPGDYWRDINGDWAVYPEHDFLGNLRNHTVVEHEEGTITASPSILISHHDGRSWHGYLERGVWRKV